MLRQTCYQCFNCLCYARYNTKVSFQICVDTLSQEVLYMVSTPGSWTAGILRQEADHSVPHHRAPDKTLVTPDQTQDLQEFFQGRGRLEYRVSQYKLGFTLILKFK